MRRLFAVLALLLCLTQIRADDLPVIKDSEAIHCVGKNVEVRGFVVSVTTSPLGTAFINFGREYPNQTLAGFIAAGQKWRLTSGSPGSKGKSSASPEQSNFTERNRRSKSCRQIRSRAQISAGEVTKTELASASGREEFARAVGRTPGREF
jgi:hypothetical protein